MVISPNSKIQVKKGFGIFVFLLVLLSGFVSAEGASPQTREAMYGGSSPSNAYRLNIGVDYMESFPSSSDKDNYFYIETSLA